jgi:hypothetical protein
LDAWLSGGDPKSTSDEGESRGNSTSKTSLEDLDDLASEISGKKTKVAEDLNDAFSELEGNDCSGWGRSASNVRADEGDRAQIQCSVWRDFSGS